MNISVVGASGVVGRKIIDVLNQRKIFADNFYLFATKKSEGLCFNVNGKNCCVKELTEDSPKKYKTDIALFSAGSETSKIYAPLFALSGAYVIDNSAFFRLYKNVPLVIPEVNGDCLNSESRIIANPNCSTIGLVPIIYALKEFCPQSVTVTTFQAVSGAGQKGITDLEKGEKGLPPEKFPTRIYSNCIPEIGNVNADGYSEEELKIINESKKILNGCNFAITATAVRVPVYNCHSESVKIIFKKSFEIQQIYNALKRVKTVKLKEVPTAVDADGTDDIFVGRIRRDLSEKNAINLWLVFDNVRKGAASNAVSIAELLIEKNFKGGL